MNINGKTVVKVARIPGSVVYVTDDLSVWAEPIQDAKKFPVSLMGKAFSANPSLVELAKLCGSKPKAAPSAAPSGKPCSSAMCHGEATHGSHCIKCSELVGRLGF